MDRIRSAGTRTFSALTIRNYRLWFIGQGISLSGTWMQTVAQGLLVLHLTGSGASLGFVTALQALPVLILAPWGGVISDRFPKRPSPLKKGRGRAEPCGRPHRAGRSAAVQVCFELLEGLLLATAERYRILVNPRFGFLASGECQLEKTCPAERSAPQMHRLDV